MEIDNPDSGLVLGGLRKINNNNGRNNALFVYDNKLFSAGSCGYIYIWNLETLECLNIIEDDCGEVYALIVYNNMIIYGLENGEIHTWNMKSEQINILSGQTASVNSITSYKDMIISGSADRTICIWNIGTEPGYCIKKIKTKDSIYSLCVYDDVIISGSKNGKIHLWNFEMGKSLNTLRGHYYEVRTLLAYEGRIISGGEDNTIRIWNFISGQCLNVLECGTLRNGGIYSIAINNGLLFSCSPNSGTIHMWNIDTGICINKINAHPRYPFISMIMNDNKLICGTNNFCNIISPINLFPAELQVFRWVMDSFNLAPHLASEIMDYFGEKQNCVQVR